MEGELTQQAWKADLGCREECRAELPLYILVESQGIAYLADSRKLGYMRQDM